MPPLLDDLVAERGLLEQPVGHVDPEAVHAAVQPEAEDVFEQVADLGVAPVEVGLGGVEEMEVPLAVVHPRPGRAAEDRLPVVGWQLTGLTTPLPEQVAGPLARSPVAAARAALNHSCSLEVWLGTRSTITLMPSAFAVAIMASKSASVPNLGSTSQ